MVFLCSYNIGLSNMKWPLRYGCNPSGCMDEWVGAWMDAMMDGRVSAHGAIDAWRDGWMCACMDALMEVFVYSVDSPGEGVGFGWMGEWVG